MSGITQDEALDPSTRTDVDSAIRELAKHECEGKAQNRLLISRTPGDNEWFVVDAINKNDEVRTHKILEFLGY